MGNTSKNKKHLRTLSKKKLNVERRKQRIVQKWKQRFNTFNAVTPFIVNNKGKARCAEENKFLLLAIKAALRRRIDATGKATDCKISWKSIENEVAFDFHVDTKHLVELRKHFFDYGELLEKNFVYRGPKQGQITKLTKITPDVLKTILDFVDDRHSRKLPVTASMITGKIFDTHNVTIHRTTVMRLMKRIGRNWAPIKAKKRTFSAQHHEALRDYLIQLDGLVRSIDSGNKEDIVLVFTDESYVNQNHQAQFTYLSKEERTSGVDKNTGKGKRLIILHAITVDQPLCERDENGYPVSDLLWKGDTPHPQKQLEKLTCETLWLANSNAGDYHNNMNSDMFFQWVKGRLCPTFEKLYPGKKMVLICDNAPYHHKREIGSLGTKTKAEIVEMMQHYKVDYVELPCDSMERVLIDESVDDNILHRGEFVEIPFIPEQQLQRSGKKRPHTASVEELKFSFVTWLKRHNPRALECQVENYMEEKGYKILWTPPYCPDLQPIERFWACGKNNVSWHNYNGNKMREVVHLLREGWYGTKHIEPGKEHMRKYPVNLRKLWLKCLQYANDVSVNLCRGIEGKIGALKIDENYIPEETKLPIDTLVLDLTKESSEDDLEGTNDEDEVVTVSL